MISIHLTSTGTLSLDPLASLCATFDSLNLIQLVHEPTHNKGTILDIVLTNSPDKVNNLKVDQSLSQFTTSDHFLISSDFHYCFTQSVHYKTTEKIQLFQSRFFRHWVLFSRHQLWARFIHRKHRQCLVLFERQSFTCMWCIHSYTCSLHSNKYPPWFNADIKHLLNKIHTLRRRLKKKTTQQKTANLNSMEVTLQGLIAKSKGMYISNLINSFSHKPRKLYQFLKFFKSEPTTTFLFNNSRAIHDPSW